MIKREYGINDGGHDGRGTRRDGQFVGGSVARGTNVRGGDRRSRHRLMRVVSSCRRLRVRLVVEAEISNHSLPSPNLHHHTERLESNVGETMKHFVLS
jgi:hypothetical protein